MPSGSNSDDMNLKFVYIQGDDAEYEPVLKHVSFDGQQADSNQDDSAKEQGSMTIKIKYADIASIAFLGAEVNLYSDKGAANGIGIYHALRTNSECLAV